jgi:hypothetical protein
VTVAMGMTPEKRWPCVAVDSPLGEVFAARLGKSNRWDDAATGDAEPPGLRQGLGGVPHATDTQPPGAGIPETQLLGASRRNTQPPRASRRNTQPPGASRRDDSPVGESCKARG